MINTFLATIRSSDSWLICWNGTITQAHGLRGHFVWFPDDERGQIEGGVETHNFDDAARSAAVERQNRRRLPAPFRRGSRRWRPLPAFGRHLSTMKVTVMMTKLRMTMTMMMKMRLGLVIMRMSVSIRMDSNRAFTKKIVLKGQAPCKNKLDLI